MNDFSTPYIGLNTSFSNTISYASWVLLILVFITSCQPTNKSEKHKQWVTDYQNGLHVTKKLNGYYFDLQYLPNSYMQMTADGNESEAASTPKEDPLQYYQLTIGLEDEKLDFIDYQSQSTPDKQRKLYYYSFGFQNDIRLQTSMGTKPCVLFHFERSMNLKAGRTFLIAFEDNDIKKEEVKLVIDSPWISSLPIKIKILKDNSYELNA